MLMVAHIAYIYSYLLKLPMFAHIAHIYSCGSYVLGDVVLRNSLACIRCGACLNGCPVYKSIGGHAYGSTYSGPIGSIITPHYKGVQEFKHLSQASSLCGKCTEICPVKMEL